MNKAVFDATRAHDPRQHARQRRAHARRVVSRSRLQTLSGPQIFYDLEPYPVPTHYGMIVEHQREQWRVIVATGTVKWFNSQKGYGFIQPQDGGGKDVFVHISAVEKAGLSGLNEGQTVEYEVVANRGKESAENIKVK
jgi:CspA family cold shock protein